MNRGSWHYTGGSDQNHPQEKEMQKGKMVLWGGLTKKREAKKKRREAKGKGEKENIPIWMESSKKEQGEIRKSYSVINSRKWRKNNRMGKTRYLFKKIRDTKVIFHAKMGSIKDRN